MTTIVLAAIGVAVLAGVAQTVSGFGYALVSVPLLALAADPVTAVFATTAVAGTLSAFIVWRERRLVVRAAAGRLTLASLVGMPLGLLVSQTFDDGVLTMTIGVVLLLAVALMVLGPRVPAGRAVQVGAGATSGVLLTSTGLSGPPLVIALDGAGLDARRFRATLQSIFCGQDLLAVVAFVLLGRLNDTVGVIVLASFAGLPLGWFIGERIFGRFTPAQFGVCVRALLAVTAIVAILGPILS